MEQAGTPSLQRDALLDRAAFYLLWHGGLRLGEAEELELEDLDLANRRLVIRKGKGLRDRTVYLTTTAVETVRAYLDVRGLGRTNHLFLYRNEPVNKDLIRYRIKAAGKRVGVNVYPHRLRHSSATQLVNAGCPVTSIQKFLGHRRLNSTMVYARVHERTVAEDYYAAMDVVEKRLGLASPELADQDEPIGGETERLQLLELAEKLAQPELSVDTRLHLVDRLCRVLNNKMPPDEGPTTDTENGRQPRAPP